ncbi:MAG: DVUA0089 family protein [Deltaproteobacteria bacterium]|nr:DVUA0089 family protein [Deltaproteobacteria bacterium]
MMRSFVAFLAAGSLAAALLVAGCGDKLECGAGTHSSGGFCVQDNPMTCDTNTAELVEGVCVAKPGGGTCGPGTKQNPANPEECIPDCGAGTSLDPITKKCVPDGALVQPNVVEKPSDEDNDPMNQGGVPINFTLPGLGQSITLAGVIGAPIEDADGNLWADFDGWKFSTTGPTLLEIEGLDVSHIRTAFFISPADDVYALERFGFNGEADQAHRKLFLPSSGDWVLMISDADNFNALWNGNVGYATPVGADDATFNYAVTVRNLALPGFDNLAPATPMVGSYEGGPRFYSIAPTIGQVVEFWNLPDSPGDVWAATAFYSPESTYRRSAYGSLTLARGSAETLFFVADLYGAMGSNLGVTYEAKVITPEDLGALTGTALTRTTVTIAAAGDSKYYKLTVAGNALISVAATAPTGSDMTPAVALYDSAMGAIMPLTADPAPLYRPGTGTVEYIVRVTDADGLGGSTYTFDLAVTGGPVTATAEVEPNETAGTATAGTGLPLVFTGSLASATDKDYYQITLSATADLLLLTSAAATSGVDTLLQLYDSTGTTKIAENDDINGLGCAFGYPEYCLSRIDQASLAAGTYLAVVTGPYDTPGNYQLIVMAE